MSITLIQGRSTQGNTRVEDLRSINGALVVTDFSSLVQDNGRFFTGYIVADLPGNESVDVIIRTPSTAVVYLQPRMTHTGDIDITFFEDSVEGTPGTIMPITNTNRNSTFVAVTTMAYDSTITDDGDKLLEGFSYAGTTGNGNSLAGLPGSIDGERGLACKPGINYVIRIQNATASIAKLGLTFRFIELHFA